MREALRLQLRAQEKGVFLVVKKGERKQRKVKQEEPHRGGGGWGEGGNDDVKRISLQKVWAGQQEEEILQASVYQLFNNLWMFDKGHNWVQRRTAEELRGSHRTGNTQNLSSPISAFLD